MLWFLAALAAASPPAPVASEGVAPESVGRPWGSVDGLLQFRGNPTRTWYGTGPLPERPRVLWRFPRGDEPPMCAESRVGKRVSRWCGTGWTGQPAVWVRPDGVTEVVFGAFDRAVHFLDAATGRRTRPDLPTGDIIKGSVTIDPDGYPLLYFGSRDNRLRVVALDRDPPRVLWTLRSADYPGLHNDDWDGNPAIVDGVMYVGGENGWFYAVELERALDARGRVRVSPVVRVAMEGWTEELLERAGDRSTSIESSVALFEKRAYFANSLGRVVGVDVSNVTTGRAPVLFDYWTGDDTDATLVVDREGFLYAAVELERFLPRAREVGQLLKLDPRRPDDPRVWGVPIPAAMGAERGGGIWSTPALAHGLLYVTTESGRLLVVDTTDGRVVWEETLARHLWSSPVVVGDELLIATCEASLRAYGLTDPRAPALLWEVAVGRTRKCIESTPAVWQGVIYVGVWDGYFYAVGDP